MKKAFAVIGQFLLFLFVYGAGSLVFHPFHVETQLSGAPLAPRSFIWDGLIQMVLVYLLLLVVQVFRGRLRSSAPTTAVALVLAAITGYLLRFGFVTHNW